MLVESEQKLKFRKNSGDSYEVVTMEKHNTALASIGLGLSDGNYEE